VTKLQAKQVEFCLPSKFMNGVKIKKLFWL
jgi:hypothetical protein